MTTRIIPSALANALSSRPTSVVYGLVLLNFTLRVLIFWSSRLFWFSDYEIYLRALGNIAAGNRQYLLEGNYLFLISYIGHYLSEVTGSLNSFFLLNCAAGALTSLVIYHITLRVSGIPAAGIMAVIIHILYTEYMVFSSVFYTPVIMLLLVSLIILFTLRMAETDKRYEVFLSSLLILVLFLLTFFFKPELRYLAPALIVLSVLSFRRFRTGALRLAMLAILLFTGQLVLNVSGIISAPEGNVISNSFVFFGHTGYGGSGGEGSFIYDENRERYEEAFELFCDKRGITNPTTADYNEFQRLEIISFVTGQPVKWVALQFRKLFRTFGIMPESTSFRILYTGALQGREWLTAAVIVIPVVAVVTLFILLFSAETLRRLHLSARERGQHTGALSLRVILMFFLYYLVAAVFYGHYQERYRLTLMVLFIIPTLAIFVSNFDRSIFYKTGRLFIKGVVLLIFLTAWGTQAYKLITDTERFPDEIRNLEQINQSPDHGTWNPFRN